MVTLAGRRDHASTHMRILHAIQSANAEGGGPIEGIRQLASATSLRVDHEIVSIDAPGAPFLEEFPYPVHALGPGGPLGYSPRLLPWLRQHARAYDAVIIHGLWRYISLGCWRALRDTEVPYFAFPHGMLDPWFNERYPLKRLKKMLFWPWTEYRMLRDARGVIFTCEEEMLRARRSFAPYRANEVIMALGIQRPPTDVDVQRAEFLARFPGLAGKRLLLFLGRIHPKKGCDLLIEAFARTATKDENVHLVVAGPDQTGWGDKLRQEAERAGIGHRVTWTGMLTGNLKWGAYRSAEAFILPSHHENFGIVVAESLACGLPVLITDKVQIWREIADDDAGLVEADDVAGTVRLIEHWLATPADEWKNMRRRALECFENRFENSQYARRFMEVVGAATMDSALPCCSPV